MSDPDSSYGNDTSNVKKLSDLYTVTQQAEGDGLLKSASRVVYVEGIGTQSGEKDSALGAGAGRGETGVAGRVQSSFVLIKQSLKDVLADNPGSEITSLTFDTFGFSRGAAAARHFANEIVRGAQGPLGDVLRSNPRAFSSNFIDQYKSGINMGLSACSIPCHRLPAGLIWGTSRALLQRVSNSTSTVVFSLTSSKWSRVMNVAPTSLSVELNLLSRKLLCLASIRISAAVTSPKLKSVYWSAQCKSWKCP